MKKLLCIFLLLLSISALSACLSDISYKELGIPAKERYPAGVLARLPWDMTVWDGMLYIGGGDYDANMGPVDIWCYDIDEGVWNNSGTVEDEEINRFCVINGTLTVPGIDPKEDWDTGNFYTLTDGTWTKHRNIPGGVHNFDMIEHDGMIFCGLGVASGEYPIACSYDGGKSFEQVKMYRNGKPIDTSDREYVRVYDLFELNGELFAAFLYSGDEISYDLYRYEDGVFVYDNDWYSKIDRRILSHSIIAEKLSYNGKIYFTTGYLYATSDMNVLERIPFSDGQTVYDITVYDSSLYALTAKENEDGGFTISVWESRNGKASTFTELFCFTYDVPPVSFAIASNVFYIGMGGYGAENDKNGMILEIKYR